MFLSSQRCCGEKRGRSGGCRTWVASNLQSTGGRVRRQGPPQPRSEVLLPPLLGLNGVQDRLPLRLVLLPDLFNLLLHHGVEGQEPLLKVFHCPALQLEQKWKVQSRQSPDRQDSQQSGSEALPLQTPAGREKPRAMCSDHVWLESDVHSNEWHTTPSFSEKIYPWKSSKY